MMSDGRSLQPSNPFDPGYFKSDDLAVFGLYGAGGFAREVMPFVRAGLSGSSASVATAISSIFFVETRPEKDEINGCSVVSEEQFFLLNCKDRYFNVAIADSKFREAIATECISKGAIPISIRSPKSHSIRL
jgi:hypothetical protein